MGYVYKITNKVNGKVYIGLTTLSIEERYKNHVAQCKYSKNNHYLYNSMRKYGIENFTVEQIYETNDFEELGKMERYYIKLYNSTNSKFGYNMTKGGEHNQLDANPRTRLTVEDVKNIRKLYNDCVLGTKECWELYKDRISYSAFEKIYEGITWNSVMMEVYTDENKRFHKRDIKSLKGECNANSKYKDEEVIEIRRYYVNHTLKETYEKYGKGRSASINSFRDVVNYGYKHLPIYHKPIKKWSNE